MVAIASVAIEAVKIEQHIVTLSVDIIPIPINLCSIILICKRYIQLLNPK